MTLNPKQKAVEIFGEMLKSLPLYDAKVSVPEEIETAKKLSLICVDFILKARPGFPYPNEVGIEVRGIFNVINYPQTFWEEVKKEIENLPY